MPDDFSDEPNADAHSDSFEEWLDQQAASKGVSKDELFQQLLSSYWTLNEMSQLLSETTQNTPLSEPRRPDSGREESGGHDGQPSRSDSPPTPSADATDDPARADELQERITILQDELQTEAERSTQLASEIQTLSERIATLEDELDDLESLSASQAADLRDEMQAIESALSADQDRLQSRLDAEFDDLETILEHLIETTDDLGDRFEGLQRQWRAEIEDIRTTLDTIQADQDRLNRVLREAADIGTRTGQCEGCEATLDISLLSAPYCPECDAPLVGVDDGRKWVVFSDPVVRTGDSADATATPRAAGGDRSSTAASESSAGATRRRPDGQEPDDEVSSADLTLDLSSDAVPDFGDDADDAPADTSDDEFEWTGEDDRAS